MGNNYFPLEQNEDLRAVRIFQLALGIVCIGIAIFWIVFSIKSLKTDNTLWATVAFLVLFGSYEILAGTGRTAKYFKSHPGHLEIKQHSVLPPLKLKLQDIKRIDILPLSVIFQLADSRKIVLRFGLSNTAMMEPVKEEIIAIARSNGIEVEEREEG